MRMPTTNSFRILGAGACVLFFALVYVFSGWTTADEQAFLPADQVGTAMQTAVTDTPGNVGRINIENEGDQTLVEVYVRTEEGKVVEVEVDAEANEVVNHEGGGEISGGSEK